MVLNRQLVYATLFIRSNTKHLMLVQVYVDNIIFRLTDPTMVQDFAKLMARRIQMSMNPKAELCPLTTNQANKLMHIHPSRELCLQGLEKIVYRFLCLC